MFSDEQVQMRGFSAAAFARKKIGWLPDGGESTCDRPGSACRGGVCLVLYEKCFEDSDCPAPRILWCNIFTSKCVDTCVSTAGCSAAAQGMYAIPSCDSGCYCDAGTRLS